MQIVIMDEDWVYVFCNDEKLTMNKYVSRQHFVRHFKTKDYIQNRVAPERKYIGLNKNRLIDLKLTFVIFTEILARKFFTITISTKN